jgi:Fe-S-cluster containining protein
MLPVIPVKGANPCLTKSCSACCHDTEMLLTEEDVARIAVEHPDVDFVFRAEDGFLQLRTKDAPSVPGQTGKPCVFLDPTGRCSIHDLRPEGCRLYPAVWDGEALRTILDAEHCPHPDGFVLAPSVQDAVRRLVDRLESQRRRRTIYPGGAGEPAP